MLAYSGFPLSTFAFHLGQLGKDSGKVKEERSKPEGEEKDKGERQKVKAGRI